MLTRIAQFFGIVPLTITDTKSKIKPNDFVEEVSSSSATQHIYETQMTITDTKSKVEEASSSSETEQNYEIQMSVYIIPWCMLWRMALCAWMYFYFKFTKILTVEFLSEDGFIHVLFVLHIVMFMAGPINAITDTPTYVKLFNKLHVCNQTLEKPLKLGHLVTGMTKSDFIWLLAPVSLVSSIFSIMLKCNDLMSFKCILVPTSIVFWLTIAASTFVYVFSMNVLQMVLLDLQGRVGAISRSSIPDIRSAIKKVCS